MRPLTSFHLKDKKLQFAYYTQKKFTYKPGVLLGNLIGNMKLIEKIMSTPIESLQIHYLPWISCTSVKCFESINHCIHI